MSRHYIFDHAWLAENVFQLLSIAFALMLVIGVPSTGVKLLLGLALDKSGLVYRLADPGFDCLNVFASSIVAAVSYYRLRAQKEGILTGDIAGVFD